MKTVDLFAGIGGNTIGAKGAGYDVVWAANHNPQAVNLHSLNHPEIDHCCQDLQQADWSAVPSHDLMMASPCCQGHTNARGKEGPHHYSSRSTAWAPIGCAEFHLPYMIFVENVPEMMDWALFPQWKACLEVLGYALSVNILDSADFGVPQHRKRLFIIGTRSKNPIELNVEKRPYVPFESIIALDSAKWSDVNKPGRAEATLERVKNGRAKFGNFFVMPYYKSGSGKTGRSIKRPIGTVTTKDRWAIVKDEKMRMLSVQEYRDAMSFPKETVLPKRKDLAVHVLGNATCPKQIEAILREIKTVA